jgi:hypothetical protein
MLGQSIAKNTALDSLDISFNAIRPKGMSLFFASLKVSEW